MKQYYRAIDKPKLPLSKIKTKEVFRSPVDFEVLVSSEKYQEID